MNAEDKFECRHQEIHDDNTNATITFGAHAGSGQDAPGGQPRKGLCWMRIAVPYADPTDPQKPGETKTSTITFGPDGQALKILPHVQATETHMADVDTVEEEDPKAKKLKEELRHLDEIEASLPDDSVDKVPKRAKK